MSQEVVALTIGLAWPVVALALGAIAAATANMMQGRYLQYKRCAQQAAAGTATPPAPGEAAMDVRFQAFAHLSRMHSSSGTAFYATLLAFVTYVIALKTLGVSQSSTAMVLALLVLPLLVLVVQGLKYYATNMAFGACAATIPFDQTNPTLDRYISGKDGVYASTGILGRSWILLTRWPGWTLLVGFIAALLFFLWIGLPEQCPATAFS